MKQRLLLLEFIALCFACCVVEEEKGTDFVKTLNRLIKATRWYVCWTSYEHKSLLIAHFAGLCLFDSRLL